jgi:hypothetical protein
MKIGTLGMLFSRSSAQYRIWLVSAGCLRYIQGILNDSDAIRSSRPRSGDRVSGISRPNTVRLPILINAGMSTPTRFSGFYRTSPHRPGSAKPFNTAI